MSCLCTCTIFIIGLLSGPSIPSLGTTNVLCHPETMVISLTADLIGFGMSLQGGVTEYGSVPITVASIDPDGPAGM